LSLLIALDDTDNATSIGTGKLSRMLAKALREAGHARSTRVTRHQLLVHPDIPYTSHNSSACIAAEGVEADVEVIGRFACSFLGAHRHAGANPGLCVARPACVPDTLLDFARRAQQEVLTLAEADAHAAELDGFLWWDGETGQGRIGALAAVALHRSGEDGRFISLPGIRELEGVLPVSEILARSAIGAVEDEEGRPVAPEARIDTTDWVRPSLRGGRPVLRVRREGEHLVPAEPRKKEA